MFTEQLIKDYENHLRNDEKSAATLEKYSRDIRYFNRFLTVDSITKDQVIAYKKYLINRYAASSVNSMLAAVNGFLDFIGCSSCRVNPLKVQKRVFCDKEKELTKAEYLRLLSTAKKKENRRLYLLMETICSTGIRVSELCQITVEAIRYGRAQVRSKGKSRTVFLPGKLCTKLVQYLKKKQIKTGPIFLTKTNHPLNRSNIWHEMKALCEEAEVEREKVFPHNLRHLFARTYYQREKDLGRLADLLGHSSVDTTRIYTITTGEEHERQVASLGLVS